MKFPVSQGSLHTGAQSRQSADAIAQTVQDLLQIAALANQNSGAAVYLPETFLTRW
ncbi:MAG: hypothetical protein ACI9TF_001917 [Paracrocinitomix sp.]|jgi:hypothetical protein